MSGLKGSTGAYVWVLIASALAGWNRGRPEFLICAAIMLAALFVCQSIERGQE